MFRQIKLIATVKLNNTTKQKSTTATTGQAATTAGAQTSLEALKRIQERGHQKKHGVFANLPADHPMHQLNDTTKRALEDANSAKRRINDNMASIESDGLKGDARKEKIAAINKDFKNYTKSAAAVNDQLDKSKTPSVKEKTPSREAVYEASKLFDDMNKDVSNKSKTAKRQKIAQQRKR